MNNYIIADLRRILIRIPLLIAEVCLLGFLLIVILVTYNGDWNSVSFIANIRTLLQFMVVFMGLVMVIAVFADDFKTKTMQVAIGIGISRAKVILSKYIEIMVLTFINLFVMIILAFVMGGIFHANLIGEQVWELLGIFFVTWLSVISYTGLTMILIFYTQTVGLSGFVYLILSSGLVSFGIDRIFDIPALSSSHINMMTLRNVLSSFETYLAVGDFRLKLFLGILVYMLSGYLISVLVFRNRELEF
ncbi:MAG: hypothetical protein Q4G60_06155 [bacterium]|nr:hypothetical protein [bacterium]